MSTAPDTLAPPDTLPGRTRRWPLLVACATAVPLAGALWWAWHAHAATPTGHAQRGTPVSVALVQQRDMPITVTALGTITAANTAVVHARVSGTLLGLGFKEGQPVRAGQELAHIDPEPYRIALAQAQAQLARDQAQLSNARADLKRYEGLVAQDAAPRQQLDTQQATVRQLEATVQGDDAARRNAQLQLSYTTVTAPISGLAGLKQVDVGNTVAPTDANGIVSIAQMRPAAVVFAVNADSLPAMRERQARHEPLGVQAWDRGASRLLAQGEVASIDNAIDLTTGTVKVKALFPNTDDALFANQPVSVRLQLGTVPQAVVVPTAAVLRGASGLYVFELQADAKVAMKPVKLLASDGDASAIQGDVHPGGKVVVDGTDRLRDGAMVEVIDHAASAAGQASGASAGAHGQHRHANREAAGS